jgi:hypothetical protein
MKTEVFYSTLRNWAKKSGYRIIPNKIEDTAIAWANANRIVGYYPAHIENRPAYFRVRIRWGRA